MAIRQAADTESWQVMVSKSPISGAAVPPALDSKSDAGVIADVVHERLRAAILSAELRPNRRLVEEEIAAWLQVSRTPVREALLRLKQEGLVTRDRGWIVRDHDPSDIRELLESRIAVEGYASRLAAERMQAKDVRVLRDLAQEMETPGISRPDINALNDRFHDVVVAAAGNSVLADFHRRTRLNYWNLGMPVVFTPAHDEQDNKHHRALITAITRHDGDRAEEVARQHVQLTLDIVLAALGLGAPGQSSGARGTGR
jgi:GntR family transcriptional regulator, rspAB operon transcriptional repressor